MIYITLIAIQNDTFPSLTMSHEASMKFSTTAIMVGQHLCQPLIDTFTTESGSGWFTKIQASRIIYHMFFERLPPEPMHSATASSGNSFYSRKRSPEIGLPTPRLRII